MLELAQARRRREALTQRHPTLRGIIQAKAEEAGEHSFSGRVPTLDRGHLLLLPEPLELQFTIADDDMKPGNLPFKLLNASSQLHLAQ